MLIGIAGDWHGNIKWAQRAIPAMKRAGAEEIWHVGDLGVGFGRNGEANHYAKSLNFWLNQTDLDMYVTLGNHEGYPWVAGLEELPVEPYNVEGVRVKGRLRFLPRGYIFGRPSNNNRDDRPAGQGSIFGISVGGASSIDFRYRVLGADWWLEENITPAEADSIIERVTELRRANVDLELFLAHDAPFGIPDLDKLSKAGGWSAEELTYANQSRAQLDRIFREVMPRQLWHGHWHHYINKHIMFDMAEGDGRFMTLVRGTTMEWTKRNAFILDTDTLLIKPVEVWEA